MKPNEINILKIMIKVATFTVSIPELSDMSIFNNDRCIATKAKISSATALSFKINSAIVTVDC